MEEKPLVFDPTWKKDAGRFDIERVFAPHIWTLPDAARIATWLHGDPRAVQLDGVRGPSSVVMSEGLS
jgi:hypothetical protein